jgi:hypothetical protein
MNLLKHTAGILLPAILALSSCEEPTAEVKTDYFPLEKNHQWTYHRRISSAGTVDSLNHPLDTLTLRIQGDVIMEDRSYVQFVDKNGNVDKLVRTDGSKYYGRHHEIYSGFSHEYVFLDVSKQPGESWSYVKNDGYSKTEYVILSKNSARTILGITYKEVIEVQVNYYQPTPDGEKLWVTALHYYANGVGEIYHYYPYPVSGVYGDISSFIVQTREK